MPHFSALFAAVAHGFAASSITPLNLALIIGVVFISAFMRGLTGFGFAIAAVPLLSIVADPRLAVGISIVIPVPSGLMDLRTAWPQSHRPVMPKLIVGAVIGTPLGMLLLRAIPQNVERIIVACAAALALLAVWKLKDAAKLGLLGRPLPAGIASGLMNGLAGMPGPPIVTFLLTQPITPVASRASMIVFFLATGIAGTFSGVLTGVVNWTSGLISLLCLGPFIIGNLAGRRLFHATDARLYRAAGLTLLLVGALTAAWKGLSGLL